MSLKRPCVCTTSWKALPAGAGGRAERARGHLDVLLLQGRDDVGGGQAVGGELVGVEPDPQRIFVAAEDRDVADAVEAQQLVADVAGRCSSTGSSGRRCCSGDSMCTTIMRSGEALRTVTPRLRTSGGRRGWATRQPVLHQHVGDIEVGAELERDGQLHVAVVGRQRRHVEHVVDAVDLLLDRRRDGGRDRLGVGAGIGGAHHDGRRHDLGILRRPAASR